MVKFGKKYWPTLVGISIFSAAIICIILSFVFVQLDPIRGELVTFWLSFFIGIIGAGVFLLLILLTEGNLMVLSNNHIQSVPVMTFLYLISGGFVAAVTQTSVGIITASNVHAIFLIGFGWQGAIQGVSSTGKTQKLTQDVNNKNVDIANTLRAGESLKEQYENEIKRLNAQLEEVYKQLEGSEA